LPAKTFAVPFIASEGQLPHQVRFSAGTFAGTVHVMEDGELVYTLRRSDPDRGRTPVVVHEQLAGLSGGSVTGGERSPTAVVSFPGNPSTWQGNIPAFTSVDMGTTETGVRLEMRASARNVEKLFHLPAGADAQDIRVDVFAAFPATAGAYDDTFADGGADWDVAHAISVEFRGVWVGGVTQSTDFPTTVGASRTERARGK
jgi:hypothetical protein